MKRILAFTLVAVLLGVVTMLAPFAPFVSEMDANLVDTQVERSYLSPTDTRAMSSKTEQAYGITAATYLPDFLFIAFMLTLSLVVAFSVMHYFMRKTIF